MDIKDSYLHSSVGVVKSIDVNADILTYKLADSNKTSINVTLPTATISTNGLLSKNDKQLLTIYQSVINVVNDPSSAAILHIKDVYASVDYVHLYVSNLDNSRKDRPLVLQNGFGNVGIGTPTPSEKLEVIGNIKATSFIGNVSSDKITLTNYAKATTTSPIATTDSLTTALGKLEYKTDFIYSDLLGGNDNDDIINKWGEIVDFIKNVKEGADITDEFVTRKTALTITGVKTFEGKSENSGDIVVPLILKNSGWKSYISTAIDFYNGNSYKEPNARISTYMDGGGTRGGTLIFYTQQLHNINPNPNGLTERLRIGDDGITKINGDLTLTGKGHITNLLTVKSDSPNLTPKIEFNEYYTSTSSWNSYIASDYYGTNICSTENFTHGLYIILGREGFGNLNILDNNKTPIARISKTKGHYFNGNMSVTGDITANKFITKNGTSSQFLKADGSTSIIYAPTTSGSEGLVLVSNGTGKDPIWSNGVKVLANYYSSRPSSIDPGLYGGGQMLLFKSTSTAKDDPAYPGDGNILHFNWDTTGKYNSLIFLHCSGLSLKIRGMNGTNWTDWKSVMFTDSPLNSTSIITSKTYSLSSAYWTDTGKTFENVATGTYAIQVTSGTNLVASGIMSIYKNLSDTTEDEIPLHVHSTAGWRPYLRTYGNKLLISSNDNDATNRTVTIKIALIL